MPPDPADLVNTILAATPATPEGRVYVGCHTRGRTRYMDYGDPRPVAARQAAAAGRAFADILDDRDDGTCGCGCGCRDTLRELADQLDTQETP